MKITKYMGAFAVIAMLAACSTDDEQGTNTAANEVKITATVGGNSIFTRSNPLGTPEEQQYGFNENDAISVTTEGKTVIYKKTGEVWTPANSGEFLLWTGNARLSRLVILRRRMINPQIILSLQVMSQQTNLQIRKLLSQII